MDEADKKNSSQIDSNPESYVKVENVIQCGNVLVTTQRLKEEGEKQHRLLIRTYAAFQSGQTDAKSNKDIQREYFQPNNLHLKTIDFIRAPRLEWDDRQIQTDIDVNKFIGQMAVR